MILKQLHRGVILLSAVVAASAFAAAACGGSDSTTPATTKPASSAPASGATTAPANASSNLGAKFAGPIPAGAPAIDQKDQLFKPEKITAKAGDTVYFSNSDTAIHSIIVDGKNILGDGGIMRPGEFATWKPVKPGTYTITCDFHPAMKASVTVQ